MTLGWWASSRNLPCTSGTAQDGCGHEGAEGSGSALARVPAEEDRVGRVSPVWALPAQPHSPPQISRISGADPQQAKKCFPVWRCEGFWRPTVELQWNGFFLHRLLIADLFLTGKCGGICAGFPSRNPQWVALSHLLKASTEHREPIPGAVVLRVTPEVTWSNTF